MVTASSPLCRLVPSHRRGWSASDTLAFSPGRLHTLMMMIYETLIQSVVPSLPRAATAASKPNFSSAEVRAFSEERMAGAQLLPFNEDTEAHIS